MKTLHAHFVDSIERIDKNTWQQLFNSKNPFLQYAFFQALENSGCTTQTSGWQPHHLLISDDKKNPVAIVPLFLKTHSYGEYVFDWAWADAYQRYGLQYYPKFVSAIPFTPATGSRIGISNAVYDSHQSLPDDVVSFIASAIKQEASKLNVSSWHCLFPEQAQSDCLRQENIHQRKACQFHWLNKNYTSFDQFLETFTARKRKNVKKERKAVQENAIQIKRKRGRDISQQEWREFYQFYHLTYFKRSGRQGYLNEAFFLQIAETMPDDLMMAIAYKKEDEQERMIAAALFFVGDDVLYGRYWGCREEYNFLHFEACYYQGIEFAIENKLKKFDPGAQGEHKIQRGFTPVATWSNHWIARDDFDQAIQDFLEKETLGVDHYIADCKSYLPFKEGF